MKNKDHIITNVSQGNVFKVKQISNDILHQRITLEKSTMEWQHKEMLSMAMGRG